MVARCAHQITAHGCVTEPLRHARRCNAIHHPVRITSLRESGDSLIDVGGRSTHAVDVRLHVSQHTFGGVSLATRSGDRRNNRAHVVTASHRSLIRARFYRAQSWQTTHSRRLPHQTRVVGLPGILRRRRWHRAPRCIRDRWHTWAEGEGAHVC